VTQVAKVHRQGGGAVSETEICPPLSIHRQDSYYSIPPACTCFRRYQRRHHRRRRRRRASQETRTLVLCQ